MYFYVLISGLGFITGSGMAAATGSWNWGLRVTPILSMVSVLLIALAMRDPPRGLSEGSRLVSTSWQKDIVYLVKKYKRKILFLLSHNQCFLNFDIQPELDAFDNRVDCCHFYSRGYRSLGTSVCLPWTSNH